MSCIFNCIRFALFRLVRIPKIPAGPFLHRMLEAREGGFDGFGSLGGGVRDASVWPLKQQLQQE